MTHNHVQYWDSVGYQEDPLSYRKPSKILTLRQYHKGREDVSEAEIHCVIRDNFTQTADSIAAARHPVLS